MSIQLGLHSGRYFWNLPTEVLQLLPLAQAAGLVTGIPLAAALLSRGFEKHWVCSWGIGLCCLALFVNPVLFILSVIPQDGAWLHAILCFGRFCVGLSFSIAVITFIAMVADATDEHEFLYGSRREALYAAGITFSAKSAIAFGGLFGGIALDLIGFPSEIATNADIPGNIAMKLGIIEGPVAAALAAISAFILLGYKLDARRFGDIQSELARRKLPGTSQ